MENNNTDLMSRCRNPLRNENGSIDIEFNHPDLGWIPFTASADDPEEHGQNIYKILNKNTVPLKPVQPPPPITKSDVKYEANQRIERGFVYDDVRYSCMDSNFIKIQSIITAMDEGETKPLPYEASPDRVIQLQKGVGINPKDILRGMTVFNSKILWAANELIDKEFIPRDYLEDKHWPTFDWEQDVVVPKNKAVNTITQADIDAEARRRTEYGFTHNSVRYACADSNFIRMQAIVTALDKGETKLISYEASPGNIVQFQKGREYELNHHFSADKVLKGMNQYASKVLEAAVALKATIPLPRNYTHNKHWPLTGT